MCRNYDCSGTVELIVEDCVADFVAKCVPFTAYDVTLAVRKQTQEDVYHRDIVGLIHNLMDSKVDGGEFNRDAHPVHSAILYRPVVVAGPAYPVTQPTKPSMPAILGSSRKPAVSGFVQTASKIKMPAIDSRKADKNGAITISKGMVRKVNWQPGDTVYAHAFTNHVVLADDTNLKSHKMAQSTVDCKGNVKVRKNILKAAGLQKVTFNVKAFRNSVEIR